MKEIELKGLKQKLYFEKLNNGLDVVLIPFLNKKNYYVNYTVKYGSVNLEFSPADTKKMVTTPKGIAHFLEHKLFEQENGENPDAFFALSGTTTNAGTSYSKTSYYIYGINELKNNLNYLISFVNQPFFTDKNVEDEKGIIIEEMKMYDDNPDWILTEGIQKATFKKHPIRYDIGGYEDTIRAITKEDLYTCYNSFYQPNNMILVVGGNFDSSEIIELIKNNDVLRNIKNRGKVKLKEIDEPLKVNNKYSEIKIDNLVIPKVALNVKLSLKNIKDRYLYNLYVALLLKILFGSTSSFREEMLKNNYFTEFIAGNMIVDDYLIIEFYSDSSNPKELVDKVLEHLKSGIITEEEFERYKKVVVASLVMESDNIENVVDNVINEWVLWGKIIENKVDIIKGMKYKELIKVQTEFDVDNHAVVILEKK